MCIIIYQPKDKTIPKEHFVNAYNENKDGSGLMLATGGKILYAKELGGFSKIYRLYKRIRSKLNIPFVIHFRKRSRGAISEENCHPFKINDNYGFVHNGTIVGLPSNMNNGKSDTLLFNENVLQKLPENFMDFSGYRLLIKDFIGTSKIVFLKADGKAIIMNQKSGVWDNGVWYSNSDYKNKPIVHHIPNGHAPTDEHLYQLYLDKYHERHSRYRYDKKLCPYCFRKMSDVTETIRNFCNTCYDTFIMIETKNKQKTSSWSKAYGTN